MTGITTAMCTFRGSDIGRMTGATTTSKAVADEFSMVGTTSTTCLDLMAGTAVGLIVMGRIGTVKIPDSGQRMTNLAHT